MLKTWKSEIQRCRDLLIAESIEWDSLSRLVYIRTNPQKNQWDSDLDGRRFHIYLRPDNPVRDNGGVNWSSKPSFKWVNFISDKCIRQEIPQDLHYYGGTARLIAPSSKNLNCYLCLDQDSILWTHQFRRAMEAKDLEQFLTLFLHYCNQPIRNYINIKGTAQSKQLALKLEEFEINVGTNLFTPPTFTTITSKDY